MEWWRFLFWNAFGGIVWATCVGLIAYYAGQSAADAITRYGLYAAAVITVVTVAGLLLFHYGAKKLEDRL
jgi:membrane protein DedA with SNARE-associated domain